MIIQILISLWTNLSDYSSVNKPKITPIFILFCITGLYTSVVFKVSDILDLYLRPRLYTFFLPYP